MASFALENDLEIQLGVPIRQVLYHKLLDYPDYIGFCFPLTLPALKKFIFRLYYHLLRKKIYQVYVKSDIEVDYSKRTFYLTLDELGEGLVGKEYLIGVIFSRADVTACSILLLLMLPKQHPLQWPPVHDLEIHTLRESYFNHPVYLWVKRIYENDRLVKVQ